MLNLLGWNAHQPFRTSIIPQQLMKERDMYIATLIRSYATWRKYRTAIHQLAALDDRSLRDIGISRSQIKGAAWTGLGR
jgi:uncharacterized protein YjiS (DUF1127 family)